MKAGDVMTRDVLSVSADASLGEAVKLMLDRRISGLPVVDDAGAVVGILSEGDLLRRTETGTASHHRSKLLEFLLGPGRDARDYVEANSRRVRDLMTVDVVCAEPSTPLDEVVELMERKHIRRLPVVQDGKLVGIVSRADLLRIVGKSLAGISQSTADDLAIENAVRAEVQRSRWVSAENVRIVCDGGVVTLDGTIFDERLRSALRVAAENTPGVRSVVDNMSTLDVNAGVYYAVA